MTRSTLAVAALIGLGILFPKPGQAQVLDTQAQYDSVFSERAAMLQTRLERAVTEKIRRIRARGEAPEDPANVMSTRDDRIDFMEAALLIRTGIDTAMGNQSIRDQAAQPFRAGMFYIHDVMAALLHGGENVSPSTWEAVRASFRRLPIYRGDTENHWLLYYTGLYLAAQTWPDEPDSTWFNGRSSTENMEDARAFLEHWMDLTTSAGQGEFDSPTYIIVFLSPLLTLRQFAADSLLATRAETMLNWVFADYAVEYLDGLYAGGHSRDYSYDVILPQGAPAVGWGWLHFGGPHEVYRSDNLLSAWSDYRLPVVINNIANDRSQPYEHRERKRVRNIFRYGDEMNPPVYKTTYMTEDYALGSIQGGILQPIQQHTWDVTFADSLPNSTLFTLHPFYSGYELAMFFPEEIEWLSEQVDRYHLVYTDPDKWNSSSPYERTFQHENVLIALYDIAPDGRHAHVDGFFPKTLRARDTDRSGWIFCDAGNTYVAVRPLQRYEWIEEDVNWRLRSPYRKNGFIVETSRAADYESFRDFKERIRATDLSVSLAGRPEVTYRASDGRRLDFRFPNERFVDGEPLDFSDWPLFEGPFLNTDSEGRLVATHGDKRLLIELK